jgi:C1A family cysteine protease
MKKYTFGIILLFITNLTFGQSFETGLIFDEEAYNAEPQMPVTGMGFESVDLPRSYSLKRYAPTPGNQGHIGSCVGWASGYGVQTIECAVQNGWTNKATITQNAFGAMYVYNHVKVKPYSSSCGGTYFHTALDFLKIRGNVKETTYNPSTCNEKPPTYLDTKAAKNKILDYVALFRTTDSRERKLAFVKNSIANQKPVLIGMRLTSSFHSAKGIWKPDYGYTGSHGHHAMAVIGYDDVGQTFEILNSWGTSWGNNGFIKVKYDDFVQYTFAAYQVVLPNIRPELQLAGSFDFRYSINISGKPMGDATAHYNYTKKHYELNKKDWQLGQRFQLVVNTKVKGQYLYVFSVNNSYKANLHYPLGKTYGNGYGFENDDIDIVPTNTEFTIPQPKRDSYGRITKEQSFRIDPVGTDYLIILYSSKSLKHEINLIMTNTKQQMSYGKTPQKALQHTLGNRLMPSSAIHYKDSKVAFNASARIGTIAPLIIEVNSK